MRGTLVVSFKQDLYLVVESERDFYYGFKLRLENPQLKFRPRQCLRKEKCIVVPSTTMIVGAKEYELILDAYNNGTEHTAYYSPTKSSSRLPMYSVVRFSSPGKKSIVCEIEAHRVIPARKKSQRQYFIRNPMIKVITKQYIIDTWGTRNRQ